MNVNLFGNDDQSKMRLLGWTLANKTDVLIKGRNLAQKKARMEERPCEDSGRKPICNEGMPEVTGNAGGRERQETNSFLQMKEPALSILC